MPPSKKKKTEEMPDERTIAVQSFETPDIPFGVLYIHEFRERHKTTIMSIYNLKSTERYCPFFILIRIYRRCNNSQPRSFVKPLKGETPIQVRGGQKTTLLPLVAKHAYLVGPTTPKSAGDLGTEERGGIIITGGSIQS